MGTDKEATQHPTSDYEPRNTLSRIADYFTDMGKPEEGQDGWYIAYDKKLDELFRVIRQERLRAKIEELDELIPTPVAEMASINYEDELKRLYDFIYEHRSDLTKQLKDLDNSNNSNKETK